MTKSADLHSVGTFEFDAAAGELRDLSGQLVPLRPQTVRVFAVLLSRRGVLVSKHELLQEVWPDTFVTDDSLVQCISEIRKALGPRHAKLLKTVPRYGYRISQAPSVPISLGGRSEPRLKLATAAGAAVVAILFAAAVLVWEFWTPSAHAVPKIAVLPFANMDGKTSNDYLSEGLSEDLLTDLSKIKAIKVFSRATSFAYRDHQDGFRKIAEELGADYLVDGSVRREGDRIRISVELVDAATGASIWAERYDRKLGELFDLQDEVRGRIVSALTIRLAPATELDSLIRGTRAIAAYDLLLKGRHEEAALSREGVKKAISFYERAIAVDANYSEAYARLANMYDFSGRFGWSSDEAADRQRSLKMAETAVRLDPRNPFAHWTYGRVLSRWDGEKSKSRQQALDELKRAIELDPNYADAYAFISQLYIGSGLPEYAHKAIETAIGLNPHYPSWYAFTRGIIDYMDGDFQKAVSDFKHLVDMNPTAHFTHLWLAAAYARAGFQDDAEWEVEEAKSLGAPATAREALAENPIIQHPEYVASYLQGLHLAGLED